MLTDKEFDDLHHLVQKEPQDLAPTELTRLWYLASSIIAKIMVELKRRK